MREGDWQNDGEGERGDESARWSAARCVPPGSGPLLSVSPHASSVARRGVAEAAVRGAGSSRWQVGTRGPVGLWHGLPRACGVRVRDVLGRRYSYRGRHAGPNRALSDRWAWHAGVNEGTRPCDVVRLDEMIHSLISRTRVPCQ
jgi:hypothetical protein